MTHKKIFLMILIITIISSIGIVSATDISDNDTTTISDQTTHTTENTIETPAKTINKNTQTSTKQATQTVTNYQELYDNLTSQTAEEDTTITLGGEEETYTITNTITVSETIKNLIIEGNGKTIDGNNKFQFINIKHPSNIIINNLTVTRCNSSGIYGGASATSNSLSLL
ncbi:hypothetical protein PXD04_01235 [Methanosphaera sp. ISO3-F5]|uniref:hypothetical protein n=1 Tax=Methanosphaera sp. ISO3-F5 TaxID=1452353 RepID=UPI002B25F175|nr:hypothetical protein [Methanosphaera sp. ISO3-F5]WQH64448.1 hypothetical protein PXD04_01235 [Methanosphaera sp. ISO3-F5]